ncbi:MAG: peptidoglycan bridge formation glycyltransferase FemA/FemB family protein [Treponema sp.]|nr:peptidoglycan bridge formation glycyltransferase FemA/FemB family protein [Treponema sp.]
MYYNFYRKFTYRKNRLLVCLYFCSYNCKMNLTLTKVQPEIFPASDNLFQNHFWGKLKEATGQAPLYFEVTFEDEENSRHSFPLLVLLRKINKVFKYAYILRSPDEKIIPEDKNCFLEELSEQIKQYLPETVAFIRYDLHWINREHSSRTEMLEIMMNYGTKKHNFKKAPTDYMCSSTCILNLNPAPQTMLKKMRQQTRNSIRRAYRENVTFSIYDAASPEIFQKLKDTYEMYRDTAQRKNFYCEEYKYFEKIFILNKEFSEKKETEDFDEGIVPLDAQVPSPQFYLFTAQKNSTVLSGLILAICGTNAYYMYAASSMDMRHCMPNYGLQWEVIRFARSKGCTSYDFMGIPPNNDSSSPLSGLYIFKTGFGGDVTHFYGTWDYPINHKEYTTFCTGESLSIKN